MGNRVRLKDKQSVHQLILKKYGTVKLFTMETGLSESTVWRILKTGRISPHACHRFMVALELKHLDLFEIENS